ncbi:MAG: sodium:proton antiporter [Clostridiales bacterium]|nr:sodium:proton antiporter [Clostridiales bacterium]
MNWMLPVMVFLPFAAALPAFLLGRRKGAASLQLMIGANLLVFALALALFLNTKGTASFAIPGFVGLGLNLTADGFRSLYALVAAFMWLMTSLFSPQYFEHGHALGRYSLFSLFTLGATLGVFLSDDLLTAFVFFEILSFTSYVWVIHEQTPQAMRAGQTYLAIAILGGMTMLMGLMMLYQRVGSLRFEALAQAAPTLGHDTLMLPGLLILAGFGAKAGMYPLHVWLPKAHPVAPAPASALLSGILTKVGVYGILVISTRLFFDDTVWGTLLLVLGLVNMVLGAVLALFSIDLKRTLACSSMSQIGFILFGVGCQALLGEHNALAAQGTVLHMLNHSLIKLVLFMAAGVVYLNTHSLNLNEIRGYGRRKPGLMLIFLTGAASISALPFFSGYASKTLLHEAIVEYFVHLLDLGHSALLYQAAEWLFVITGGLTFCYMIKLFVAIFVERHPSRQTSYDRMGRSMSPLSATALGLSALVLFALGLHPEGWLTSLATRSLPFLHAHEPAHAVHFLAWVNLSGGLKSLLLGVLLYPLARKWLMVRDEGGQLVYVNRWPAWLDLEDRLYRPLVSFLVRTGTLLCTPLDLIMDRFVFPAVSNSLTFISRVLESLVDGVSLLLMRTMLKPRYEKATLVPHGNRLTYALGRTADVLTGLIRRFFGMQPRGPYHYVRLYALIWDTAQDTMRRILRTLSFGLILFALGLVALLALLLLR